MPNDRGFLFEVTENDCARVTVSGTRGELGVLQRPGTAKDDPSVDFGLSEARRFNVKQPYDPEAVRLVTLNQVPVPAELSWQPATQKESAYVNWATERGVRRGLGLVRLLPPGDYLLTFSARRPDFRPHVVLGARRVDSPTNVFSLLESEHLVGLVIGSQPDAPPDFSLPLVGLTILNYVGSTYMDAVLFFSLLRPAESAGAEPNRPLLIVPLTGELVIDGLEGYGESLKKESLDRWTSTRARQFIELAASGSVESSS